jgi:ubiquitin-protein ligase
MYKGGAFIFSFVINMNYPHEPPKVKCTQTVRRFEPVCRTIFEICSFQIYHPNVDLEGNVCLNILREDWKPVLNLNSVMVGLQYLFLEPNADDPLNKGEEPTCKRPRSLLSVGDRCGRGATEESGAVYIQREAFNARRLCQGCSICERDFLVS